MSKLKQKKVADKIDFTIYACNKIFAPPFSMQREWGGIRYVAKWDKLGVGKEQIDVWPLTETG